LNGTSNYTVGFHPSSYNAQRTYWCAFSYTGNVGNQRAKRFCKNLAAAASSCSEKETHECLVGLVVEEFLTTQKKHVNLFDVGITEFTSLTLQFTIPIIDSQGTTLQED
jgi:hypothetical protein